MIYLDRAIQKYRSDGLRSLFVDGASIVASPQLWCIRFVTTVGLCPVTRSELRKIAIHEYRIRDMESITIPPREEYPVEFARLTGKHILGEPFVAELTDAYLFGPHGICLTNDGRPILETVMARRDKLERKLLETPSATIRLALSRRCSQTGWEVPIFLFTSCTMNLIVFMYYVGLLHIASDDDCLDIQACQHPVRGFRRML